MVVGQNVDDRGPLDPLGMVEAHARGGAGAAVVPGDKEFAIAEPFHDFDLVLRHGPERIVDVVVAGIVGTNAVPIAAHIGGHDVKPFGQPRRDLAPRGMGQRIAVQ